MKKLFALLAILPVLAFANANKSEESNGLRNITLTEATSINFNSKFTSSFVAKKQMEAMKKCLTNLGSDIYIVLYTPGGSVSAGQRFFDSLHALPCKFHTITIFSASMGYQTVQNLGNRYIVPSGILMSHRARISGLSGEIGGELDSIIKLLKDNIRELNQIASDRIGIELNVYENLISDELWLTGIQAVTSNHADELVLVKCDKSLMGSYFDTVHTMFGRLEVEFSRCPIITGALSVSSSRSTELQVQEYYQNLSKYITTEL